VFLINSRRTGEDSPALSRGNQPCLVAVVSDGRHDTKYRHCCGKPAAHEERGADDFERQEKAREKTNNNAKDLLPAMKDIMVNNTPDKQDGRSKHYIIISPALLPTISIIPRR